jgi:hypothetical protein
MAQGRSESFCDFRRELVVGSKGNSMRLSLGDKGDEAQSGGKGVGAIEGEVLALAEN